jgi:hypothetical protein
MVGSIYCCCPSVGFGDPLSFSGDWTFYLPLPKIKGMLDRASPCEASSRTGFGPMKRLKRYYVMGYGPLKLPEERLSDPRTPLDFVVRELAEAAMSVTHHDCSEYDIEYVHEIQCMERRFRRIVTAYSRSRAQVKRSSGLGLGR